MAHTRDLSPPPIHTTSAHTGQKASSSGLLPSSRIPVGAEHPSRQQPERSSTAATHNTARQGTTFGIPTSYSLPSFETVLSPRSDRVGAYATAHKSAAFLASSLSSSSILSGSDSSSFRAFGSTGARSSTAWSAYPVERVDTVPVIDEEEPVLHVHLAELGTRADLELSADDDFRPRKRNLPPAASAPSYTYHPTSPLRISKLASPGSRSARQQSGASSPSGRRTSAAHPFASGAAGVTSPQSSRLGALGYEAARPESPGPSASSIRLQSVLADPSSSTSMSQVHQVAFAAADDVGDEELCPICVESLSFTYRLPGEKPHVVPECGHALHEVSFAGTSGRVA